MKKKDVTAYAVAGFGLAAVALVGVIAAHKRLGRLTRRYGLISGEIRNESRESANAGLEFRADGSIVVHTAAEKQQEEIDLLKKQIEILTRNQNAKE